MLTSVLLHVDPGSGILSGFLHPLLGLDHLLAMLTVGLLSAQIGGRAVTLVPVTFLSAMVGGGVLGLLGIPLPVVELGIAFSVIALGLALFIKQSLPEMLVYIFVALFGLLHGHAHGTEVPSLTDGMLLIFAYVVGFVIATAGLHLIGAILGIIAIRNSRGEMILRASGLAIALVGVVLFRALL